jgi:hypothetical protein
MANMAPKQESALPGHVNVPTSDKPESTILQVPKDRVAKVKADIAEVRRNHIIQNSSLRKFNLKKDT